MNTNIVSYEILAEYYDKIYNYQKGNKSFDEVNNFIMYLLTKVRYRDNFLDVGCGTGIYTNLIYDSFKETVGIDPCQSMINKCNNPKITFKCLFLNQLALKKYNFISCFSQILNHLSTKQLLDEFIKDASERLKDNGILYFDIFNYDFFNKNKPMYESRFLSEDIKYNIQPESMSKSDDYINMVLNNEIVDHANMYKYKLSMFIWNFSLIESICTKYEIKVLEKYGFLDKETQNIHDSPKISVICQKVGKHMSSV